MRLPLPTLLCACLFAAFGNASAGSVTVSFLDRSNYTDAGNSKSEEEGNLNALARHLQKLGQRRLPADQSLKVEVLDVDLAGTPRPSRRGGPDVRIVKGKADWPRIKLRYQLERGGQTLRSGEETLADLDYIHGPPSVHRNEPLYYEKRLLNEWFTARFVENAAASR